MVASVQFRFGDYAVDRLGRTVLHNGELKPAEPKVFDVLLYLLTHRNRVVTKQELLESCWAEHVVLTEGVVARTVMKARKLIGDDAEKPFLIKTVHRVGYRFVATVDERQVHTQLPSHRSKAAPVRNVRLHDDRIAILPFRNETGNEHLAWIDLGLMSTTIDAIAAEAELHIVSETDVLAVIGAQGADVDLQSTASKISNALGAANVVQSVLTQDQHGELTLHYQGTGPRLAKLHGVVSGFDPIALCQMLARAIESCMAGGDGPAADADDASVAVVRDTHFARVAHARALQAIHAEGWETACKLLRVAIDLMPDDAVLQLDYARCLVAQRDPSAAEVLERVLSEARKLQNKVLELRALHHLAIAWHSVGRFADADRLLSEGLKIAEQQQDQEAELQLLVSIGETLAGEGRAAVANWMLDRAGQLARALGNQVVMAKVLDIRGRIATFRGDHAAAMEAFAQATKLSEEYGIHSGAAFGAINLGSCLLNVGRIVEAAASFARAFQFACRSGNPVAVGLSGSYAVRFGELRSADMADALEIVEQMRQISANRPVVQAFVHMSDAMVLARQGRLKDSVALLDKAEHAFPTNLTFTYHVCRHRIRTLVCLGLLEEAADLCGELESRAIGRFGRSIAGIGLHSRALIARADGDDAGALKYLLDGLADLSPSLDRADAALDAAWLHLEFGDVDLARELLAGMQEFMDAALASEYAPAMLVRARLLFHTGDVSGAAALQRRYCEMLACRDDSDAVQCLALYEGAQVAASAQPCATSCAAESVRAQPRDGRDELIAQRAGNPSSPVVGCPAESGRKLGEEQRFDPPMQIEGAVQRRNVSALPVERGLVIQLQQLPLEIGQ